MKRVAVAALVLAAAAGVYSVVRAQGGGRAAQPAAGAAPQRNWYSVSIFSVKPERARDFADFMKSQVIPMQQKGGITYRDTWQSGAPFGDAYSYGVVTNIAKFAEYDMPNLQTRILGAEGARAYADKIASMINGRRTFAVQDRLELSIPPAPGAKIVAAVLTETTIVSGHAEQFEAYIKNEQLPLLKRDKDHVVGYQVSRTTFGGDANQYTTLVLMSKFAEIDDGPANLRLLSAAERTAMAAKLTPHVAHAERQLLRYVPDLSFRGKPIS